MNTLELTLAHVLASIEQAKSTGNAHALIALLQRKHAICETLAAPEQAWFEPARAPSHVAAPHQAEESSRAAA